MPVPGAETLGGLPGLSSTSSATSFASQEVRTGDVIFGTPNAGAAGPRSITRLSSEVGSAIARNLPVIVIALAAVGIAALARR